jgi:GWxTD domain-containing protein
MRITIKLMPLFVALSLFLGISSFSPPTSFATEKEKMSKKHKKWLDEEVVYIISKNEKEVFKNMTTGEQREEFIRKFWERRDPTPRTPFNEFKEEHYRRIEYAKRRYFEGTAGWRSDRGRVYIMFGPPDFFETNPGGGRGFLFDASGPTAEFPAEVWTYRYIPGLKLRQTRIDFTFVNYYNSGKYQLVSNPALANALRNTSIEGSREIGYERTALQAPKTPDKNLLVNPIEQLTMMAELTKSRGEVFEEMERSARLRKLRGVVDTRESLYEMPFQMSQAYLMGENESVKIPISIEIAGKDVAFTKVGDRYNGTINYHIEVKDRQNSVYQSNERLVMSLLEQTYQLRLSDTYQYKHRVTLLPGEYWLHVVVWDENDNKVGHADKKITVPKISKSDFSLSDIILARSLNVVQKEKPKTVDSKDIQVLEKLAESGLKVPDKVAIEKKREAPFRFGNIVVEPSTTGEYSTDQEFVFFYQVYGATFDPEARRSKVKIVHQIEKGGVVVATIGKPQEVHLLNKDAVIDGGARHDLSDLQPGTYTIVARVTDLVAGKTLEKRANFKIK